MFALPNAVFNSRSFMHCTVVDKVIIIIFKDWGAMLGLKATIITVTCIEIKE